MEKERKEKRDEGSREDYLYLWSGAEFASDGKYYSELRV